MTVPMVDGRFQFLVANEMTLILEAKFRRSAIASLKMPAVRLKLAFSLDRNYGGQVAARIDAFNRLAILTAGICRAYEVKGADI